MGLVKISEALHASLRTGSAAFSRSINAQAEHWMRIGMLSELYPSLNYAELSRLLFEVEQADGDLHALIAQVDAKISESRRRVA